MKQDDKKEGVSLKTNISKTFENIKKSNKNSKYKYNPLINKKPFNI